MKTHVGETTTKAVTEIVIDRQVGLQRIGIVPVCVDRAVEVGAAEGRRKLSRSRGVGKGKGRAAGRIGVREGLKVLLQRLRNRVKQCTRCCDVVVAGATANGCLVALEGTIRKAKPRHDSHQRRGPQACWQTSLHIGYHWSAVHSIECCARRVRVCDTLNRACIDVCQLLRIEGTGVACRIDQPSGTRYGWIEITSEPIGRRERWMILVAKPKVQVEPWGCLPAILRVESIGVCCPVIILADAIALVLIRHTDKEVSELVPGG